MGSRFLLHPFMFAFLVAVFAVFAPSATVGKTFMVGDEAGWTIGFDYQSWAKGKTFRVGDTLVFRYPRSFHNVYKVNGTEFQNCIVPKNSSLKLDSGNDVVTLATAGRKWYICGVAQHCKEQAQKLVIQVQPAHVAISAPSPSPAVPSAASGKDTGAAPSPAHGWQRPYGPSSSAVERPMETTSFFNFNW